MKKIICLVLVLLMILSLSACGNKQEGDKDLLATIKERGKIIVATEGKWSPYTYHDGNDVLTGFDVEMARLIAQKLGVEVEFFETDWDSILAGVDSGRFDIACNGVGYTESRAEKYNFSTPYVYMGTVLVVKKGNESVRDFTDLAGKKTANTASSTYAMIAKDYGAEVIAVDDLAETIMLLERGDIDATLNAVAVIADYLYQHPEADIEVVAASTDDAELDCIPVVKSEYTQSLLDEINRILDELRADGSLATLSKRFFGDDYTSR